MNNIELLEKFNTNKTRIAEINSNLNQLSVPIHEYEKRKRKTDSVETVATHITSRITGSGVVLTLIPFAPFRIAGLTILSVVAVCKGTILYHKLREKKYKQIASENRVQYNDLFLEQYKLIAEQKELEKQINNSQSTEDKQNLINRLSNLKSAKLDKTSVDFSSKLDHKKDISCLIDIKSKLTDNELKCSSSIESRLTDDDIYRTVEF